MSVAASRTPAEGLALVRQRVRSALAHDTRAGVFPHPAPPSTGVWAGTPEGNWTSGSWAGLLWHECALGGRAEDADTARAWTLRLAAADRLAEMSHPAGRAVPVGAQAEVADRAACCCIAATTRKPAGTPITRSSGGTIS